MLIATDQPCDVASTLESGQAFRWRKCDPEEDGGHAWYEGVIFGNVVGLRQRPDGIEFRCGPDSESTLVGPLRHYLRLDDDLRSIYRTITVDEHISSAVERYPGLRIVRQDPWECLISFICSANSNIRRITSNVQDMSSTLGRPIELGGRSCHAFPSPEELASAGEGRLRELGLGFRAKYVASVADIVANGGIDLLAMREASYDDTLQALVALPGVGDKVANCAMLFSLDKLDAFPVDVWVHRALVDWYPAEVANGKPLSRTDMRLWAQDRFKPYSGYANQYLFHDRRVLGRKPGCGGQSHGAQ